MQIKRNAIIALHLSKKSAMEIVRDLKQLKINQTWVYRTIKRYSDR